MKKETSPFARIVAEIRKDKKPYALKVAKELEESTSGNRVLNEDAANCLRDDCRYICELADRIEAADTQRQKDIIPVIAYLVKDGMLLQMSDKRNGKPYRLFGEPLVQVYFRLAAQIYRQGQISRKAWLEYLQAHDSDPKGMAATMTKILAKRRQYGT